MNSSAVSQKGFPSVAIAQTKSKKGGRPPADLGDLLVALSVQSYFNKPSRKAMVFQEAMVEGGYLKKGLAPVTLRRFNKTAECTELLRWALQESVKPVREIERVYAIDSSHFGTPLSDLTVEYKSGKETLIDRVRTAKFHIAVGVRTKMIFAGVVTDGTANDKPLLMPLLKQLSKNHIIDAILADSGYYKHENYEMVAALGARAYIDFPDDAVPSGTPHHDEMYDLWKNHSEEWHAGYDYRNLVETGNFMLKETNRRKVRARLEQSRENELLAMAVVHNLCRLLMVRKEFDIAIPFADPRAMNIIARADAIDQGIKSGKVVPFRAKPQA